MTAASEVHLFDWIRENGPFLGPIFLLFIGMAAGWVKVMVSRYPTRTEIHRTMDDKIKLCGQASETRYKHLEEEQNHIMLEVKDTRKELNAKMDLIGESDRAAHAAITAMILELKK